MPTYPQVEAVRAFSDNYIWLIHNGAHAVLVDPGDATPALQRMDELQLSLSAILLTHHHGDHIGGVAQILQTASIPVYGPALEKIPGVDHPVLQGKIFEIAELGLAFDVLDVPGHTLDHIAFHAPREKILFCGDTLFGAGCGRLFEGTPEQMLNSLNKLAALPPETQVYCAHEYTLANLRFAMAAEPSNEHIRQRMEQESAKRSSGYPTLPSTLARELETNPFLRCTKCAIIDTLGRMRGLQHDDSVSVFAELRTWKNIF